MLERPRIDFVIFAREVHLGPRGISMLDGGSTIWRWSGPGDPLEVGVAIGLSVPRQPHPGALRVALRVEDEHGHLVYQMAEGSLPLTSAMGTTSRLNLASMLDLPVEHYGPHRLVIQLDDQEPEALTLNVMPPVD